MNRRTRWPHAARAVTTAVGLLGLVLAVPPAAAQSPTLRDEGQFEGARAALFGGLANQVGSLPNPTGGGFSFTLDPALGVFTRTTESFGSVFASRYETTGQGKFTVNASYSRHTFDEVDGVNMRNGQLNSFLISRRDDIFPGLVIFDLLSIKQDVSADVGTLGFLYGATDRIDVGLTIPILKVKVKESVSEQAFFVCTGITGCFDPGFPLGSFQSNEAEQTGLGDIVLRGKYNFLQLSEVMGGRFGMAFGLDVKLPTGDKGDRQKFLDPLGGRTVDPLVDPSTQQFQIGDPPLGTGIVRVRPLLITSGSWFGFSPRINVGAELGTTTGITNDLIYEVGADYTFFGRATLSADLLGRHAFGVDRIRVVKQGVLEADFGKKANPDTLTASFGLKVNPFGTFLVFFNVLLPLNEVGVRDDLTPTFGIEWTY